MTKGLTYPRRGLHGELVHSIGVQILRGDLKPGDQLPSEEELSREMSVSRTVLRETTKVLAAKRLVQSRPKTGTRVRPRADWNLLDPDVLAWQLEAGPNRQFLEDILELRRLIEPEAARLAAERASDEELAALQKTYEEMEEAGGDFELFREPDLRFHALILRACGNELLEHMAATIVAILQNLFVFAARPPGAVQRATPLHGAIAEAIGARDPDAAERAVHRLIDDTTKSVEKSLRSRA